MDGGSQSTGSGSPAGVKRRVAQALFRPELIMALLWLIPVLLGGALGAVGWLISGWPWWPLVGAVVVWTAVFLHPLFWPGMRAARSSLFTELLIVFWPRRGMSRAHAEEERRFRRASIPLYGLPAGFPGGRRTVATGTVNSWRHGLVVAWLSLGHGDSAPFPGGTWLIVETAAARLAPDAATRRKDLARRVRHLQIAPPHDLEELRRSWAEAVSRPDLTWSTTMLEVDGTPVEFEFAAEGECWAAWAARGDLVLSVLASRMPAESVNLVPITDIEPYIEGARLVRESPACPFLPPQPQTP